MPRKVKEWEGKTDESRIPPRVRQRVFDRDEGKCRLCGNRIDPSKGFELDHVFALINGGRHAESNLAPVHSHCHRIKTAKDVKEKAKVQRTRQKHTGAVKPKGEIQSRGFARKERKPKDPLPPRRLYQ